MPHFHVRARTAYTNKIPAGHFRATGKTQTTFGIECTIDSVARQMGLSPYELRLKNVLRRGERVAEGVVGRRRRRSGRCPADGHGFPRHDASCHRRYRLGMDDQTPPRRPVPGPRRAALDAWRAVAAWRSRCARARAASGAPTPWRRWSPTAPCASRTTRRTSARACSPSSASLRRARSASRGRTSRSARQTRATTCPSSARIPSAQRSRWATRCRPPAKR